MCIGTCNPWYNTHIDIHVTPWYNTGVEVNVTPLYNTCQSFSSKVLFELYYMI